MLFYSGLKIVVLFSVFNETPFGRAVFRKVFRQSFIWPVLANQLGKKLLPGIWVCSAVLKIIFIPSSSGGTINFAGQICQAFHASTGSFELKI